MSQQLKELKADSFIRLIEGDNDSVRKLHYIIPDAQTLVRYVTKYRDEKHDIMDRLVFQNKIDTFDKIIKHYFSENTPSNQNLCRIFITSHAQNGKAKDFHYFYQYFDPKYKRDIQALLCANEKDKQKILQTETPDYTKTDEISQKLNFYEHIRTAYFNTIPKISPYGQLVGGRYTSKNGTAGIINEANEYQETFPCIRLVMVPKDQKKGDPQSFKTFTILPSYSPKQHNLARQTFNAMHFPDIWIEEDLHSKTGYFNFLNEFDKAYHQIRENEPVAFALFKNFNHNGHIILLENIANINNKMNMKPGAEYVAYSGSTYIGFCCDNPFNEETLRHELTHNIGEFENTDIYRFITVLLEINKDKTPERQYAVNESHEYYQNSEYLSESLARIVEFKKYSKSPDPLLEATRAMFNEFADAKYKDQLAIINRIKLCARRRLLGYSHYEKAYECLDNYYTSQEEPSASKAKIQAYAEGYKASYDKAVEASCQGKKSAAEEYIIQCIQKEMRAIKELKKTPNADKIVLGIDVLERDNITETPPLEVLIARTIERTQLLYSHRTKNKSLEDLQKNLCAFAVVTNQNYQTLQQEQQQGVLLDRNYRNYYLECISNFCKSMIFADELIKKYNPQHNLDKHGINIYVPDKEKIQYLNAVIDNVNLINSQNKDTKISPQFMERPFFSVKEHIDKAEETYQQTFSDVKSKHLRRIYQNLKRLCHCKFDDIGEEIKNLRLMQLIYRELNPKAKTLPPELRFENLSYKDFTPIEDKSITDLSDLPATEKNKQKEEIRKQKKEEKLKKLKEKYKDSKEKYEEIEKEFKKSDEYKPHPNEEISPCAKAIRFYARRLINSEHFAQMTLQTAEKIQPQSR